MVTQCIQARAKPRAHVNARHLHAVYFVGICHALVLALGWQCIHFVKNQQLFYLVGTNLSQYALHFGNLLYPTWAGCINHME